MDHPKSVQGGWVVDAIIFDDGKAAIAVALVSRDKNIRLALRWNPSFEYKEKSGEQVTAVSLMDGETGWFLLPFDFSVAIAKQLIERKITGHYSFNENGFERMVKWLVDENAIADSLSY